MAEKTEDIAGIANIIDNSSKVTIDDLKNIDLNLIQKYYEKYSEKLLEYLPSIATAIVAFLIGLFVIKYIEKALEAFFKRTKFDEALENFIQSFIVLILKLILFVIVIGLLGVKTSSFMAVFGAMVFAIGMALQGSLSNFAGGILLLFFKPFKIGDFIESDGHKGYVINIQIFNTILKTLDGERIILPNGQVSNNTIINFSTINNRRLDLIIGIDYSDDILKAKKVLQKIVDEEKRILKNKEVIIAVSELGDNSVNLLFRSWTTNKDYWDTRHALLEKIKLTFDKEGLSFPFSQRDVHIYNEK